MALYVEVWMEQTLFYVGALGFGLIRVRALDPATLV